MANRNISTPPKTASIAKMTRASRVTFGGAASNFLLCAMLAVFIWRPVIFVEVTSPEFSKKTVIIPMGLLFTSKSKCHEFAAKEDKDMADVMFYVNDKPVRILGHEIECLPDTSSQGV